MQDILGGRIFVRIGESADVLEMMNMPYRLQWTERKKEDDYGTGFGIGPRFHPRFSNTKVVNETDRTITFERIVLDSEIAADQARDIRSWDGNFGIKVEKIKKGNQDGKECKESKILEVICPVCLQKVGTYTDEGLLKIDNHNYEDSQYALVCPGSGDELK
jgi:hypothetical protein